MVLDESLRPDISTRLPSSRGPRRGARWRPAMEEEHKAGCGEPSAPGTGPNGRVISVPLQGDPPGPTGGTRASHCRPRLTDPHTSQVATVYLLLTTAPQPVATYTYSLFALRPAYKGYVNTTTPADSTSQWLSLSHDQASLQII